MLDVGLITRVINMVKNKRRGFKRIPEIKHKPTWQKGDMLQHTKFPSRIAIVKDVVQDWDEWKYIIAEMQRSQEDGRVVFDDICEIKHGKTQFWVKFKK